MADSLAVILAGAGKSTRFGAGRNKLLVELDGRAIVAWSAAAFLMRKDVACVYLAAADEPDLRTALGDLMNDPRFHIVPGGPTRAHSVQAALEHVPRFVKWVAVHDAARALVSQELIDRVLAAAIEHGAAGPALPVALTIKEAVGPLPAPAVRTIPRSSLWAMQTPQIIRADQLRAAYVTSTVPLELITDDLQLLETVNRAVWLVPGEERNLKVTTPLDLQIAERLIAADRS